MLYIKNTRGYSTCINVRKDNRPIEFVFDCERYYSDTGNLATTGVTAIEKEDFDFLMNNCKQFRNLMDKGLFVKVSAPKEETDSNEVDKLKEELKKEKSKVKKLEAKDNAKELEEMKKQAAAKDEEIKSLKQQLEAKVKEGSDKKGTEGF